MGLHFCVVNIMYNFWTKWDRYCEIGPNACIIKFPVRATVWNAVAAISREKRCIYLKKKKVWHCLMLTFDAVFQNALELIQLTMTGCKFN